MDYLLKSSAIIGIFFLCYKVFLQRDTFFESNRWFLLSGLVFASCISFIVIPNYIEYTPIAYSQFEEVTSFNNEVYIEENPLNYHQLLTWIYMTGILFFVGKLSLEFLSLKRILRKSQIKRSECFKLVETTEHISPFSFFNYIVYNPMQFDKKELQHVINHEKAHAEQLHSIDIIFAQLICILLWFNPIAWIYKKSIQQNLEFIADQKAINLSGCEKSYQTVLLKVSVKNHQLAFTNNFYTSLIKKRIIMLHKSKSKQSNKLKLALVLPVLVLFLMSFNTKDIYVELTPEEENVIEQLLESSESIEIIITKNSNDADLENIKNELKTKGITFNYEVVERNSNGEIIAINTTFESDKKSTSYNILEEDGIEPFRFKSSQDSFSVGVLNNNISSFMYKTFGGDSIKIQSTKNSKKVILIEDENDSNIIIEESDEPLFIINGNIVDKSIFEDVDSEDILSVFILDEEKAENKYGEKGENGAVIMSKKNSKIKVIESDSNHIIHLNSKNRLITDTNENEPLFILNGKIISKKEINAVNPNEIESMEVYKGEEAQKLYGDKGKNGVIILKLIQPNDLNNEKNSSNIEDLNKIKVENYLYILDGKDISKLDLEKIYSKESVSSLIVLNSKEATEKYGEKGRHGVVEVISKKSDKNSKSKGKTFVLTSEEDGNQKNPWKIETVVSSVYFTDDNGSMNSIEFVISKNSTDAFLNKQKNDLKGLGIEAKFSKIRRNKAGEITSIKISLDDNEGRKSSASWKEKDQAIPDIIMGKSNDDKLYIRAIGN
jgi:hypothetical protein